MEAIDRLLYYLRFTQFDVDSNEVRSEYVSLNNKILVRIDHDERVKIYRYGDFWIGEDFFRGAFMQVYSDFPESDYDLFKAMKRCNIIK